jgi:hypothetical protein
VEQVLGDRGSYEVVPPFIGVQKDGCKSAVAQFPRPVFATKTMECRSSSVVLNVTLWRIMQYGRKKAKGFFLGRFLL